ncbi:hypothetical protein [Campylobacter sputorum]|uniref:hypothetical protein n=1 Tax=Campylobacter sputorum TaxID=206 RepID=UPI00053BED2A|nr:hypothetical protein [Campylobacter sputorum]KAB0581518.1 hypothetical protein F7P64_06265 [Campylobacter sputorum subsp. sputorum]
MFIKKEYEFRSLIRYYGINKKLNQKIQQLEENYKFGKSHKIDKKLISNLINEIENFEKLK